MAETKVPKMTVSDLRSAKQALINVEFFATERWRRQQERANRRDADPEILEVEKRLITAFRKLNIPMFTVFCRRSNDLQDVLFNEGRSKARGGESPHNYGMAIDVVHSVMGWQVPRLCWDVIGHVGKEAAQAAGIKVRWGGDFQSLYDPAHWELADWRDRIGRLPS